MSLFRVATATLLGVLLGGPIAQAQAPLPDVTGKWLVVGASPTGPVTSTVLLTQDGGNLSGSIEIARVGWAKVTGAVRGDTVRYVFPLTMQGTPIEVQVTGVLQGPDSMAGSVELPNDLGSYPFTARRQPPPPPDAAILWSAEGPDVRLPPSTRARRAASDLAHDFPPGRSVHAVGSPYLAVAARLHTHRRAGG